MLAWGLLRALWKFNWLVLFCFLICGYFGRVFALSCLGFVVKRGCAVSGLCW